MCVCDMFACGSAGKSAVILIGYGLVRRNWKTSKADLKGGLVLVVTKSMNSVMT